MVTYTISHKTTYHYQEDTALSCNVACMHPRESLLQKCLESSVESNPEPDYSRKSTDIFGNYWDFFSFERAFRSLNLEYQHKVEVHNPWRNIKDLTSALENPASADIREILDFYDPRFFGEAAEGDQTPHRSVYLGASPFIPLDEEFSSRATAILSRLGLENAPAFLKAYGISMAVYRSFEYKPQSTDIFTPVLEVARHLKGVCQDYAHYSIALLRNIGIPARYVSGYLHTRRDASDEVRGADASHAWISAWLPPMGWVDFDPTNGCLITDQHITIAWGRDYTDVTPLRGVVIGGGAQTLDVAVAVTQQD